MVKLNHLILLVGFMAAGALIYSAFPDRWFEVLMIFGYGVLIGHALGNPDASARELAPLIPWEEMHSNERLAYFLGPLVALVFGGLLFTITWFWSRTAIDWAGMALSIAMILGGFAFGALKWKHRHAG